MPGRKSNVSTTSNGLEEVAETMPARQPKEKDGLSVEDLSLPKSMVQRIAKGNLPANTQIHKDALLALHKSATVFVSYLAANANDNAQASGKKTISPQDVMAALKDAEMESFLPVVEAQLKKHIEIQCDKRNTYRRKVKEEKAKDAPKDGEAEGEAGAAAGVAQGGEVLPGANGTANGHDDADNGERPFKKLKGDAGVALAPAPDDADNEDMADDQDADVNDDEEAADDDVEEDDDDDADQTMEDALEEQEPDEEDERGELRDEALDEPDSD